MSERRPSTLGSSSVCVFSNTVREMLNEYDRVPTDRPDLIPANTYPRQMMQGIFALKHLLASGYRPSDVCCCH